MVLGVLAFSFPRDLRDELMSVPGVVDVNFIYGPYDFYVMIKTETKEKLREVVLRIRGIEGVRSTMTCNVVSMRPTESPVKE